MGNLFNYLQKSYEKIYLGIMFDLDEFHSNYKIFSCCLNFFLTTHVFTCFFMTGLIWLVQVVHYPTYKFIDKTQFQEYQIFHTTSISWIVVPIMIIEIISGVFLLFSMKINFWNFLNLLGVFGIWLVTFLFSVNYHNQLHRGFDLNAIENLILTNWFRTIFWTLRSLGWIYFLNSKIH